MIKKKVTGWARQLAEQRSRAEQTSKRNVTPPDRIDESDEGMDDVAEASDESFPASDPPSWTGVKATNKETRG